MIGNRLKPLVAGALLATLTLALAAAPKLPQAATEAVQPARFSLDGSQLVPGGHVGPLGVRDEVIYQELFELQSIGQWRAADALIGRLQDPVLLGHVLYQRFMHPTAYRSEYEELRSWLEAYADHPGAERIYRLALKRRPAGAPAPEAPLRGYLGGAGQEPPEVTHVRYRSKVERTPEAEAAVRAWRERIADLVAVGQADVAADELERADVLPLIDEVEADLARWTVARGHFAMGEDAAALSLAGRAAARTGRTIPEIHWMAGISAWRLGRVEQAARHFAALADAEGAHPAERARAAFWAARCHLIGFKPQLVTKYLALAADHPGDFYGLLARAVLGVQDTEEWQQVAREESMLQVLLRFPGARRALALGQVGQHDLAEDEVRKLAARSTPELMVGLIALAEWLDLPAAQMRLAQSLRLADGRYHAVALYPLPSWQPAIGFTLDRALVFAIMRAESGFDPAAQSHAGAQGLMQVMPATARDLARRGALELPGQDGLFEPETGMLFGQAYLEHLLQSPPIGDNLIHLVAAYNAGPARVMRWQRELQVGDDPLLFLESIPMNEPRAYVKKVLTNFWHYRARLGQRRPSLDALAGNRWPHYRPLDRERALHAWN